MNRVLKKISLFQSGSSNCLHLAGHWLLLNRIQLHRGWISWWIPVRHLYNLLTWYIMSLCIFSLARILESKTLLFWSAIEAVFDDIESLQFVRSTSGCNQECSGLWRPRSLLAFCLCLFRWALELWRKGNSIFHTNSALSGPFAFDSESRRDCRISDGCNSLRADGLGPGFHNPARTRLTIPAIVLRRAWQSALGSRESAWTNTGRKFAKRIITGFPGMVESNAMIRWEDVTWVKALSSMFPATMRAKSQTKRSRKWRISLMKTVEWIFGLWVQWPDSIYSNKPPLRSKKVSSFTKNWKH